MAYETGHAADAESELTLGALGSGSDYTPFLQHSPARLPPHLTAVVLASRPDAKPCARAHFSHSRVNDGRCGKRGAGSGKDVASQHGLFPFRYRGAQNAIAAPTLESFMRVACCMMPVQC